MFVRNNLRVVLAVACLLSLQAIYGDNADGSFDDTTKEYCLMQTEAELAVHNEKYTKAAKIYRRLGKSTKKLQQRSDMYLKAADCLFEANKTFDAMEAYSNLVRTYPLYVPFDHVVGRIRKLAERYADGGGTFLGIRDKTSAINAYTLIIQEAPAINVSMEDRKRLAELLVDCGREEEAVGVFQELLKIKPDANNERLDMALLLLKISKRGDGDGAIRRAAERHAKIILANNPDFERKEELMLCLTEAREQEASRILQLGKFYLRKSSLKPKAARTYFLDLIQRFPGTKSAWEAKKLLDENPHLTALAKENKEVK